MHFTPHHTLNIIEDAAFAGRMDQIRDQLEQIRVSGDLLTRDGVRLFYEYFLVEKAIGSVVLLHGMSEFTCKHYELAYYLMEQGYHVFLYDQRGHGRSQRLTDRIDLIHVDDFSDFVEDLQEFLERIVKPAATEPLYLYGHSMGGAVSLLHLAAYPGTFRRAVISSPLFEPIVAVPNWLAYLSSKWDQLRRGPKTPLTHGKGFIARIPEEWKNDPACSRNKYMMQLRIDNEEYQTTPLSAGFALQTLYLTPRLLKVAKAITTPHLLISGTEDTVVKIHPHGRFAKKAPLCQFLSIPGGKHAMMCDDQESAAVHTHLVLDYFREGQP